MSSSLALAMLAAAPLSFLICTSLVATAKRLLLRRVGGRAEGRRGGGINWSSSRLSHHPARPPSLPAAAAATIQGQGRGRRVG